MTPNGEVSIANQSDSFEWLPPEPPREWDPLQDAIVQQVVGVLPDPPLFLETLRELPVRIGQGTYPGDNPDATQVLPIIRPEGEGRDVVGDTDRAVGAGRGPGPRVVGVARPSEARGPGGRGAADLGGGGAAGDEGVDSRFAQVPASAGLVRPYLDARAGE